jgi:beta-xylosidase
LLKYFRRKKLAKKLAKKVGENIVEKWRFYVNKTPIFYAKNDQKVAF